MRGIRNALRRCWFVFPVLASLATDCQETPRGAVPTGIATVEIVLRSRPATPHPNRREVENCLARLGTVGTHVRPGWRDNPFTGNFDPERVPLVASSSDTFTALFRDVPVNTQHTLTVHDVNQCERMPVVPGSSGVQGLLADGRVTTGVFANGTPLTTVVGNSAFVLFVAPDGTIAE